MKKQNKKLKLTRQTIRILTPKELTSVPGGNGSKIASAVQTTAY